MRLKSLFEDAVVRNLSSGILYLLLILLLGREVEWVAAAMSVLLGIAGVWLVVRSVVLLCGKVESRQGPGCEKQRVSWRFPGYALLYALVLYLQGFLSAVVVLLTLAGLAGAAMLVVITYSKTAK